MSLCFAKDVRGKPSTVVVVDDFFIFFFLYQRMYRTNCAHAPARNGKT